MEPVFSVGDVVVLSEVDLNARVDTIEKSLFAIPYKKYMVFTQGVYVKKGCFFPFDIRYGYNLALHRELPMMKRLFRIVIIGKRGFLINDPEGYLKPLSSYKCISSVPIDFDGTGVCYDPYDSE
jgi:hypothetical protein